MSAEDSHPWHSEVEGIGGKGFASPALLTCPKFQGRLSAEAGLISPAGKSFLTHGASSNGLPAGRALGFPVGSASAQILTPTVTLSAIVPNRKRQNLQLFDLGKASHHPASMFFPVKWGSGGICTQRL